MKILILFILTIATISSFSQRKNISPAPNVHAIYGDYLYMAETEVTNIMYLEYLYFKRQEMDSASFSKILPDTLVWRENLNYGEPYTDYYLRHPAYRSYPVVGVSKEQASLYCAWLTQILNMDLEMYKEDHADSVLVRLPTDAEWTWAAKGGNDYYEYPWAGHNLRVSPEFGMKKAFEGQMMANFVRGKGDYMGIAGSLNDNADITAPVRSYWPNDFGLYNCAGNVAEMVADKNVAKGGSWQSSGYDIKVTSEVPFTEPKSYVGFRYIVEVKTLEFKESKKRFEIEKDFVKNNFSKLNESILVQNTEVTNELYNLFLNETEAELPSNAVWDSLFPYFDRVKLNYSSHLDYANFPAVGMTKADASNFCKWLNERINYFGDEYEVSLMADSIWMEAARGGLDLSPYPWGGPYLHNAKGCALANYKYVPESFSSRTRDGEWQVIYPEGRHDMFGADFDGALFPAQADSYHPNDLGFFCMAGNVREMVIEDGYTKGGGWNSADYYLQITSKEEWNDKASAEVGFRVMLKKK